jgi:hypothetical protein
LKRIRNMSVGELAAYIATHLRKRDIEVVLSGGSCVAVYSEGKFVSDDLDFIETRFAKRNQIRDAMIEIGFTPRDRYYTHAETAYFVEFPSGPLAVGKEPVTSVDEIEFSTGVLRILSPTDCVKDRLAAYYHWNDRQSLEQAVLVAEARKVDLREIARWSRAEGMADTYARIKERLR